MDVVYDLLTAESTRWKSKACRLAYKCAGSVTKNFGRTDFLIFEGMKENESRARLSVGLAKFAVLLPVFRV